MEILIFKSPPCGIPAGRSFAWIKGFAVEAVREKLRQAGIKHESLEWPDESDSDAAIHVDARFSLYLSSAVESVKAELR